MKATTPNLYQLNTDYYIDKFDPLKDILGTDNIVLEKKFIANETSL